MFEHIVKFFKKLIKEEKKDSKDTAKERLHLVLMQDRANVSADFMELMKQEIIEVIKKYIDVDENSIDVKLTNKVNSDGTTGAPILYANIPILNVKDDTKQIHIERNIKKQEKKESSKENKEEKMTNQQEKEEKKESKQEKKEEKAQGKPVQQEEKKEEVREKKTVVKPEKEKEITSKTEQPEEKQKMNSESKPVEEKEETQQEEEN